MALILMAGVLLVIILSSSGLIHSPRAKSAAEPAIAFGLNSLDTSNRIILSAEQRREAGVIDPSLRSVRSLLKVRSRLRYGDFLWDEKGIPAGPVWIKIDLEGQTLSIFKGGHEIGTAVVLYGIDGKPTPRGTFHVLAKSKNHQSIQYDAPMPYSLWLTNDGVAIHGSDVRWGAATHGCVGVPRKFAALLFDAASVGDRISISP